MNPIQIIATLRKLGNYLAGLFPFLSRVADWLAEPVRRKFADSVLETRWTEFRNSPAVSSVWKFIERFYWRNYSKDRLDFDAPPPESLVVLRPIFQLCALLCVLIPLTQFPLQPVAIETFSGFKGSAPMWSVLLWVAVLPCAWSSLLTGAALSNRVVYCISAVGAIYFLSTCVLLLQRDFANALLTTAAFLSLFYCERNLLRHNKVSQWLSVLNAVVVGGAAGIQLYILTPIKPLLSPHLPAADNPAMSLVYGGSAGVLLGITCLALARSSIADKHFPRGNVSPGIAVWSLVSLLLSYLIFATVRGGISAEGGMLISSVGLTNSYLWPIWYFVGVGVVHKLIGSSKSVTGSIQGLLPPKAVLPILVTLLIGVTIVCGSDHAALALSTASESAGQSCFYFFAFIYQQSKAWLWTKPIESMAAHWFLNVLLVNVAIVLILALQKKLTSEAMIRLFYLTGLAALLIWEYLFQLSSFARTPPHSVVALFLFSAWLLWLMHTVGWNKCLQSSPAWPSRGRLPIFAGVLTLALLEIHSRGASKDIKVVNELFLVMFRGAIDVGLPYFLFTWVSRRVPRLPVTIPAMLGLFSIGALTAFAFNVLDKAACANYIGPMFVQIVDTQARNSLNTGNVNVAMSVPQYQLLIRSLLYTCGLVLVFYCSRLRWRFAITTDSNIANMFLMMAFGSGVASFSHALVDLPVTTWMRALIAPLLQETTFNCNVFLSYLAYWLPALMLGVAQTVVAPSVRRKVLLLAATSSIAFNFFAFALYQQYEAYLRATDTLYLALVMVSGVLVLFVMYGISLVTPRTAIPPTLLSSRSGVALILIIEAVCAGAAWNRPALRLTSVPVANIQTTVQLAESWKVLSTPLPAKNQPNLPATFVRRSLDGTTTLLQIGELRPHSEGMESLMKQLLLAAAQSGRFPNLRLLKIDQWHRFAGGALACHFSYSLPSAKSPSAQLPESGLTVLVPNRNGRVLFFSLFTSPSAIELDEWEIALALQKLGL
ncbi:MAG: hypothetical protein K2W95_25120 [Candidatus Obscuribacterales bacterium]|nr:hypothetical protein [Candidatus Obscuribacterales bacterium]